MNSLLSFGLALLLVTSSQDLDSGAANGQENRAPAETLSSLNQAILARDFAALDAIIKSIVLPEERRAAVILLRPHLSHAEVGVRRLAAYSLSQIDPEEAKKAIPALIDALKDNEARVRARVALALGEIGPPARDAVPILTQLLNDENPRGRAGAARALGLIGAEACVAIPQITERLKDKEPPVRIVAAFALGQMGLAARGAASELTLLRDRDEDAGVRQAAASALEAIHPSLKTLIEALKEPDANRRLWSTAILAGRGPEAREAVPELIELLKRDGQAAVRAGAALALGKIGRDAHKAVPALTDALRDPADRVRTAAILALGAVGDEAHTAAPALAEALNDEIPEVAESAATALGSLGRAAEEAVPTLLEYRGKGNALLRRRAINVLARIGPGAQLAAPALLQALGDSDATVRREAAQALVSAGPQTQAPVHSLVEALRYNDSDMDRSVRAWACLSLSQMGPQAAAAAPSLVQHLQDDDVHVRAAAVLALGRIGAAAAPALVQALDHIDFQVRMGAAAALGNMGAAARRTIPSLLQATHDEDSHVRLAAVGALGRIAGGLQMEQDLRSLPGLNETLQALKDNHEPQLSGPEMAEWKSSVDRVHVAVQALRTVERAHFWDRIGHSAWFPWVCGGAVYLVLLPLFWGALLWLRPILLLHIGNALRMIPQVRLPALLGSMEVSLRGLLLLKLFQYHPRVLDAWVGTCLKTFQHHYEQKGAVKDRRVYVPMPLVLDGQVLPAPSPKKLGLAFASTRGCLLIWGEGGVGKTSLACQIGYWAMAIEKSERLCKQIMLPVLIEHELDVDTKEGMAPFSALTEAVRGQLQANIDEISSLSEELVENLLRRRRVVVIVDHLSETGAAARGVIQPGHADFPAHALVVTSRKEESLDGVPRSVVQPMRIEGNRLSTFMEGYLVQRGKRSLFDDAEYFDGCRRLSALARGREVTPLFAKLYAEQMIARKESGPDEVLPTNLPDLMLGYVNELNRCITDEHRRGDFEVQRDAMALAWECLRHSFCPEAAGVDAALDALGGEDASARLRYLAEHLRLVRIIEPACDRLCFTLDPLAEYLAALHLVQKNRSDLAAWNDFLAKANAMHEARAAVKDFMVTVIDCCKVRKAGVGVVVLLNGQMESAA